MRFWRFPLHPFHLYGGCVFTVKTSETKAGETDAREEEEQDVGGGFPDDYGMPEMPDQVKIALRIIKGWVVCLYVHESCVMLVCVCVYVCVCVCAVFVCVCVYTYTACLCVRA